MTAHNGTNFQFTSHDRTFDCPLILLRKMISIQILFVPFQSNNNYGRIELVNDGDSIYEDLQSGLPLLFEIIFASQNPIPKLVAIYKNGKQICNGHVGNKCGDKFC